jgi:hypothetical protein
MLLKSINIHDQQVKLHKIFSELARILIQLFLHTIVNYYWLLNPLKKNSTNNSPIMVFWQIIKDTKDSYKGFLWKKTLKLSDFKAKKILKLSYVDSRFQQVAQI